jgi:large subunit ribosomal protein L29
MKISEIKDMPEPELNKKFRDLGDELLQLRVRKQTGQVEKPHLLKTLRRDRARVLTVLRQQKHSTN